VTRVTLVGKPGCHLCDDARSVVSGVLADFPAVAYDEVDILEDKALHDAYWEQIPVVLVDGRLHGYWRIDAARLREALSAAAQTSSE